MRLILTLCLLTAAAAAQEPRFDVTSVKPSGKAPSNQIPQLTESGFRVEGITLRALVRLAFQLPDFQITGLPSWADSDRFDIDARAASAVGRDQVRLMLLPLLAGRFQLATRRETRDVPALALRVAKEGSLGPKMKPADASCADPTPNICADIRLGPAGLTAHKVSMQGFAQALGSMMGRPVVDRTNLKGVFDFNLEMTMGPDRLQAMADIFGAIEAQLGLRMDSTKSPVTMLVIDRVVKPSEN